MTAGSESAELSSPPGRLLRLFWTGLSFFLFGLGALVLGFIYFPLLFLVVNDAQRRQATARETISFIFGLFLRFMAVFLLDYRISGVVRGAALPRTVVVANHPTLIDAVFLIWLFPQADCVVKADHWRNPLMMFAVRAAGYLPNNDDEYLMEIAVQRVRDGACLVLFPEGTRTRADGSVPFRRGAAVIAERAGADILPVRLDCQPPALRKGQPWFHIPNRRATFEVQALPLVSTMGGDLSESEKTRSKKLTQRLKLLLLPE